MLTALSMIFAYIETLIPFSFGIPGIKLGLANLVVLTGLYFMPTGWVFTVLILKVTLVSVLFGNLSMLIYSMAGGIVSFLVMLAVQKRKGFSIIGVSIAGGVSHNLGQLAVAVFVVESIAPLSYMPILMIAGAAAGTVIGMVAYRVRRHLGKTYISGEK